MSSPKKTPKRWARVYSRPDKLGGGYSVRFYEGNRRAGGAVIPVCNETPTDMDAYAAAFETISEWTGDGRTFEGSE